MKDYPGFGGYTSTGPPPGDKTCPLPSVHHQRLNPEPRDVSNEERQRLARIGLESRNRRTSSKPNSTPARS